MLAILLPKVLTVVELPSANQAGKSGEAKLVSNAENP
jgi:hypothetical protein